MYELQSSHGSSLLSKLHSPFPQSFHQSINSKKASALLEACTPLKDFRQIKPINSKDLDSSRLSESQISCSSSVSQRGLRSDMKFSSEEKMEFGKIYNSLRAGKENQEKINVLVVARYLRRSGLPREVLKEIWVTVVRNGAKEEIHKSELFGCLKLIGLAQRGLAYNSEALLTKLPAEFLPTFPKAVKGSKEIESANASIKSRETEETVVHPPASYAQLPLGPQPRAPEKLSFYSKTVNSKQRPMSSRFQPESFKDEAALFNSLSMGTGEVPGTALKHMFLATKIGSEKLSKIWSLVDIERKGALSERQFIVAMHLIYECKRNEEAELRLTEDMIIYLARDISDRDISQETETIRNLLSLKLTEAQREISNLKSINFEMLNERKRDDMLLLQMINAFQELTKGIQQERSLLRSELTALDERKTFLKSFAEQATKVLGDACQETKSEREHFVSEVRKGFEEISIQLKKIIEHDKKQEKPQSKAAGDPFQNFESFFYDKSWQK